MTSPVTGCGIIKSQRPCIWKVGAVEAATSQHAWASSYASDRPEHYFAKVPGLLLSNYAGAGATPLPWPTEMTVIIAVGHCNSVLQA